MGEDLRLKLPNGERAIVPDAKLSMYLLSSTHPFGRSKARFFERLGFSLDHPEHLRVALLDLALSADMQEITFEYGKKYTGPGFIVSPTGRTALVVTVWVMIPGAAAPTLVTAYPG